MPTSALDLPIVELSSERPADPVGQLLPSPAFGVEPFGASLWRPGTGHHRGRPLMFTHSRHREPPSTSARPRVAES